MSEWKPIETAPKDGTTVILFWPFSSGGGYVTSGYTAGLESISPGEWQSEVSVLTLRPPTHWMPLLQPPAGGATAVRAHTTASDPDGDAIEPIISQATGG